MAVASWRCRRSLAWFGEGTGEQCAMQVASQKVRVAVGERERPCTGDGILSWILASRERDCMQVGKGDSLLEHVEIQCAWSYAGTRRKGIGPAGLGLCSWLLGLSWLGC